MAFFQRDTMIERGLNRMLMLILVLVLGAGCTSLKSGTPESTGTLIQNDTRSPVNYLHKVEMSTSDDQVSIHIKTEQTPAYTSIKQDFPLGVAVYLPDTVFSPDFVAPRTSAGPVAAIRSEYADTEKTTIRLEMLLNQDLAYEVLEEANGLQVVLNLPDSRINTASVSNPEINTSAQNTQLPQVSAPSSEPSPARVTNIEFNPDETGYADIQVTTTESVPYDTAWKTEDQLDLILYNARIPEPLQRPLLTRYTGTAVDSVTPYPGSVDDTDARIEIRIREKVPYQVVQDENRIFLRFDPVYPVSSAGDAFNPAALKQPAPVGLAAINTDPPEYSGEKIKLDFFDTDIKNVFRILRSVSGLNFAVDKDVQGKVTMTLEKPVPWDQVLDLVLKMNGLGKKMEGDVVRIATIQTLRQEEKDEQEAIDAQKKALEQKKSLEPLITEYIPISYSNAKTEIEPHITSLLTPERGTVSVDQRSNMVIVTDTREKVDQIQEMIYRLDTVTPQIMIEAKIVEVTKEFSRDIGIGWNLTNDPAISSGFVNDMNVSVNTPIGDGGMNGDFSFFRLFGASRLALNAKLAASEARGDVKIVSSPRILTLDNKEARIKQGLEYPFQVVKDDDVSTEFKEINLELVVTPHVTPDERISMQVFLTKNDVAGIATTGEPYLNTNEAKTELLVNDNDTVVIGGIVKTTNTNNDDGLPFLSGIPIIGNMLFGSNRKEDNRNELLIFLTPSIVQLEQKRQPARSSD
ncbi:type IV pilus secretin PilQ [Desulfotignum phosphitoxidans]|uniref:Type 4 pilus biogenesis and competence protein PilQ n=1 Tax=Desulfotignum phosphitoxidans DSM 13687 TaxID=1286635 RepID=S0G3J6_9BACT|nr:type IV pilus secretin PilQ [Desulfotignum phosphitoxidans]EMS78381.1 type 4 pilus biogenesis and competence protein PilQ [Desulfotignum phosphitoxidans DSM 13687]